MSAGAIISVFKALWDEHSGTLDGLREWGDEVHPRTEGDGFASFPQGLPRVTTK